MYLQVGITVQLTHVHSVMIPSKSLNWPDLWDLKNDLGTGRSVCVRDSLQFPRVQKHALGSILEQEFRASVGMKCGLVMDSSPVPQGHPFHSLKRLFLLVLKHNWTPLSKCQAPFTVCTHLSTSIANSFLFQNILFFLLLLFRLLLPAPTSEFCWLDCFLWHFHFHAHEL